MAYRIVKITTYYRDFLTYYYAKNPEVGSLSYKEQHAHLMKQRFAWSDAYAFAFDGLGHEATELVANAKPLQEQWWVEFRPETKPKSHNDILVEQLKALKPDVIWLQDSYSYNGTFITHLKTEIPSIKLAIGNCCSPITPQYYPDFKTFDFITVCSPYFKTLLEQAGLPRCLVIPHAFDRRILNEVSNVSTNTYDFLFSGSLILDQNFHRERILLLESLVKEKVDINLLINLNSSSSKGLLVRQAGYLASRAFSHTGLDIINQKIPSFNKVSKLLQLPTATKVSNALTKLIKSPVFGLDMFKEIAQSKIAFNSHGDIAATFAANMRLYEVTGMGTCLLTDWKNDLKLYFDEDELVTYQNLNEAKEKIQWLLSNPIEIEAIAARGQQRTLTSHTFEARATVVDEEIRNRL